MIVFLLNRGFGATTWHPLKVRTQSGDQYRIAIENHSSHFVINAVLNLSRSYNQMLTNCIQNSFHLFEIFLIYTTQPQNKHNLFIIDIRLL